MKKEILDHIKNEKEISRYKISLLQSRSASKKYRHRLISMEREFLEYPFEAMSFSDVDEARNAISTFKTSRSSFNKIYVSKGLSQTANEDELDLINKKIYFFEKKYEDLLDERIKKINIFEDNFFIKSSRERVTESLGSAIGPDAAAKIEGAFTAKKRARIQVVVYCLARFIYHKVQSAKETVGSKGLTAADLRVCEENIDHMFDNFDNLIFRYYNDGIKEVPLLTNGTLGHNKYLSSVYPLSNLLDSHEDGLFFQRVLSQDLNFFSDGTSRPIRKKFVERGFSAITNIKRVGNEVIDILYSDIWSESKNCLNKIVSNSFYNILSDGEYYKSIGTIPVWHILEELRANNSLAEDFIKLIGLDGIVSSQELISSDEAFAECVNSSGGGRLFVSAEYSKILVPITRSEAGHIKESLKYIDLLITEIKDEYNKAIAR